MFGKLFDTWQMLNASIYIQMAVEFMSQNYSHRKPATWRPICIFEKCCFCQSKKL